MSEAQPEYLDDGTIRITSPRGLARVHAGKSLQGELSFYGVSVTPCQFEDVLITLFKALHPDLTTEQMMYHPRIAVRYCETVCEWIGAVLPEHMILRRLNNIRKKNTPGNRVV